MKRFVETTPRTIRYDGNSNSEDMVAVMLVKKQKIDTKKFSSSAHSSGVLVSSILVLTKNIRSLSNREICTLVPHYKTN